MVKTSRGKSDYSSLNGAALVEFEAFELDLLSEWESGEYNVGAQSYAEMRSDGASTPQSRARKVVSDLEAKQ